MSLIVKAHRGDAKTLLAFDLPEQLTARLAGFTIQCRPHGHPPYYLYNKLQFETPGDHAQVPTEPPRSSVNAPFHQFRWLHVPGTDHQGIKPFFGPYTYTVTPRYFDDKKSMLPLDPSLSVSVDVDVVPFETKKLEIRFTRGYTQSQAFVQHFGRDALIRPKGAKLIYDTSQVGGADATGTTYTYRQMYEWLGFTAREKVFEILNGVLADTSLRLDVFAYDLNEPDLVAILIELAEQGRIRVILDSAALHHTKPGTKPKPGKTLKVKPEDEFEKLFRSKAKAGAEIKRGKFGRYAHDKILVVSGAGGPRSVLTGSTNFSVTGFYVNSNHVLVFSDPAVMSEYAQLFEDAWGGGLASAPAFVGLPVASKTVEVATAKTPKTEITFSPHSEAFATQILTGVATRIQKETSADGGSVLFAVMQIDHGTSPVYTALNDLHKTQTVFSYGISDSPAGISVYEPGKKNGVLVTGKPVRTQLPRPFSQVPDVGLGHQIHHKFVVCGFNGDDPVVYCGSSNLAIGGEELNGDNLLAIHDRGVATAFAIEAVALVDHFQFLDRFAQPKGPKKGPTPPPAQPQQAAQSNDWFLSTTDRWTRKFYDPNDLHCMDRQLFAR
jgi:phosphatidylserine/phosphatidylglycerophosphate/cardiolipin synthase-like enzyme